MSRGLEIDRYIFSHITKCLRRAHLYLVHTDVALVTEHHVVPFLAVGRAAHIADDVLIVLNPQTFHRLDGVLHVVMALTLQGLHGALHCQLVYGLLP